MKSSILAITIVALTLAAGCSGGKGRPSEILYRAPAGGSVSGPAQANPEYDDVIQPREEVSAAGDVDAPAEEPTAPTTPTAPVAPSEGTGTESHEGDGLRTGTDPEIPVEVTDAASPEDRTLRYVGLFGVRPPIFCSDKNFAFVSNRGGRSDIYLNKGTRVDKVTASDDGSRRYHNLSFRPGSKVLSADDSNSPTGSILVDLSLETPSFGRLDTFGTFSLSHAWNADGSKLAYIAVVGSTGSGRDFRFISEIRIDEAYGRPVRAMRIVASNAADPSLNFGKVLWWGDKLIYSANISTGPTSGDHLYVVDTTRTPYRIENLKDRGSLIWGSQPAVNPAGTKLAYVLNRTTLYTCDLSVERGDAGGPDFQCRNYYLVTPLPDDTRDMRINTQPAWSADGRWIYFTSERSSHWGNKEIYRIRPDGSGEERLTDSPGDDDSPTALPDTMSCSAL